MIKSFLLELVWSVREIPSSAGLWWRSAHTRTLWLREWQKGDFSDPYSGPLFFTDDAQSINSWMDYNRWLVLGKVTDTILILIVVAVIVTIGLAIGG